MNVGADSGLKEPRTGPAGRGLSLVERPRKEGVRANHCYNMYFTYRLIIHLFSIDMLWLSSMYYQSLVEVNQVY